MEMVAIIPNFQLIVDNCFDCADIVAASLLVWRGYRYEIMFINSWGFSFQPAPSGRVSDGLSEWSGGIVQPLELYLGIKSVIRKMEPQTAWEFITEELRKGRPVVLNADLYWCPWHEHYQKNHRTHSLIILGSDARDGTVDCMDKYTLQAFNGPYRMSFNQFAPALQSLTVFSQGKPVAEPDWRVMVREAIWCMKTKADYDRYFARKKAGRSRGLTWNLKKTEFNWEKADCCVEIRLLAAEINSSVLADELFVKSSPLLVRLISIGNGRRKFAYCLRYLGQERNEESLVDLARIMELCSWQWNSANKYIYNYLKTGDISEKNRFCDELKSLAVFEEMIADKLIDLTSA
jgi:hypothetical protein